MNNKIREIAHQATEWCEQNAQGTPVAWEWEEKFGELIVKECVSLFDGTYEIKTVGVLTHQQIIEQIKNHFGVEE